jgi:hypothetical protein
MSLNELGKIITLAPALLTLDLDRNVSIQEKEE